MVNTNDVIFDDEMIAAMKDAAYAACHSLVWVHGGWTLSTNLFDIHDLQLSIRNGEEELEFFERYLRLVSEVRPKGDCPFAGKYILGGKLARLNSFRGVADAAEVCAIDDKAVILQDDGGEISTADLKPSGIRVQPYREELKTGKLSRSPLTPIGRRQSLFFWTAWRPATLSTSEGFPVTMRPSARR